MRLIPVWLHVLGMAVWVGGIAYQSHVLLPAVTALVAIARLERIVLCLAVLAAYLWLAVSRLVRPPALAS